jgi:hypothetical protein
MAGATAAVRLDSVMDGSAAAFCLDSAMDGFAAAVSWLHQDSLPGANWKRAVFSV